MAVIKIVGDNPTLAHIALAMNEAMGTAFKASDIAEAATSRDIRPRDGRVSADALPHIFHELRIRYGVKVCNPATVDVWVDR